MSIWRNHPDPAFATHGHPDSHPAREIPPLVGNTATRSAMAAAIRQLAQPDATWDVATLIRHLTTATKH